MATRKILFRGQTRRKGEKTSISGIPLPGIWVVGGVFLVGNQVHVMQGIAGSKDGEATTYKDTNANSIAAGKCKFVAKNSGILFV